MDERCKAASHEDFSAYDVNLVLGIFSVPFRLACVHLAQVAE
jgi:hypothetical protein